MKKSSLILASATLLMSVGAVQAATNAQMTITASVVTNTCDVSISNSHLDLGNFTGASFKGVGTPVAESIKTFTIGLSGCKTSTNPAWQAGDVAKLVVSGQTLGGNPNIFNSTGTNTGIMLSEVATPTAYIKNGDQLTVATAPATNPGAADFNGKSLRLQAGLASTSANPDIGLVNAPILFSFAYN